MLASAYFLLKVILWLPLLVTAQINACGDRIAISRALNALRPGFAVSDSAVEVFDE